MSSSILTSNDTSSTEMSQPVALIVFACATIGLTVAALIFGLILRLNSKFKQVD